MPSSTSHSERAGRLPRLALLLVTAALAAVLLCGFYTLAVNPEVRFFCDAFEVKRTWATQMEAAYSNKVVFYGGSSCDTSIDPERLLHQHRIPAANFGLGAGMGPTVLSRMAMQQTRPGDTLIIALEPGLLESREELTSLGTQFATAQKHREWLQPFVGEAVSPVRIAAELRPGGYHTFTLLGKLALRRSLYRYHRSEIHPGGWHEITLRLPLSSIATPKTLSQNNRAMLKFVSAWSSTNQVKLFYSMPRGFVRREDEQEVRAGHARLLLEIVDFVPVLKDPMLGADSAAEHFADMSVHPTRVGAEKRTDAVAQALKSGEVWTREELQRIAAGK
jgi:hypothetical protein